MFSKKLLINKKSATILLAIICYNLVAYFMSTDSQGYEFFGDTNKTFPFSVHSERSNYTYPLESLDKDDYRRLINVTDFTFTILPKNSCSNSTFLLVVVHSAPQHFKHRDVIRNTWGSTHSDLHKVVFLMGSVKDPKLQKDLAIESRLHADLAQGNFVDVYRNLTYKHMTALKYAIYHCPQAKYILKTDDDVFVNMPLMDNFLTKDLSIHGASNLIFCNVIKNAYPLRGRSKWQVTVQEYAHDSYPTFCLGWVILYSPDVVFSLYKSGQKMDFFWIDDVQMTGVLAKKDKIPHTDARGLLISSLDFWLLKYFRIEPKKSFLFGRPDISFKDIEILWKYVLSHPVPGSIFKL